MIFFQKFIFSLTFLAIVWLTPLITMNTIDINNAFRKAITTKDRGQLAFLIDHYDANCRNKRGNTPLHFATNKRNHIAMRMLICDGNVIVNSRNKHARTPLHRAAIKMDPKGLKILLTSVAFVNAIDDECRTPLHYVLLSDKRKIKCAQLLIARGANLTIQDKRGLNVIDCLHWHAQTPLEEIDAHYNRFTCSVHATLLTKKLQLIYEKQQLCEGLKDLLK